MYTCLYQPTYHFKTVQSAVKCGPLFGVNAMTAEIVTDISLKPAQTTIKFKKKGYSDTSVFGVPFLRVRCFNAV